MPDQKTTVTTPAAVKPPDTPKPTASKTPLPSVSAPPVEKKPPVAEKKAAEPSKADQKPPTENTSPKKPEQPEKPAPEAKTTAGEKKSEAPKAEKPVTVPAKGVESKPAPPVTVEKKPVAPPKEEKTAGTAAPAVSKPAPSPEKKPELPKAEKLVTAPAEGVESKPAPPVTAEKKPVTPPKEEKTAGTAAPAVSKPVPSPEKKPEEPKAEKPVPVPAKGVESKPAPPAAAEKKSVTPPKEEKKPEPPKTVPAPAGKKPTEPPQAAKASAPLGIHITRIFDDRLDKPDEDALKALPVPQEGEGFSMRLHPDYFFDFLDHPFSVNREVQDYKDLFESIKATGINEPVKARPREGGGLELLSGHRRHDIAKQLGYPVPVVIVQEDEDTARIEVVDGNLHRQDIPTSELARAAKMKMDALARKSGRRSKLEQLAQPQKRTDQIVAEDMGMSRNQVNRLVRINSLVPELKQQVDDKKLPFNTAVELSFLKPQEQSKVVDFMKKEQVVPSMAQATALKEASRAAQEAQKPAPQNPIAPAPKQPAPAKVPAPVDEKKIASIVKTKEPPEIKYTFTSSELKEYFPEGYRPSVTEVKRKVFDALDLQKKTQEKDKIRSISKAMAR